MNNSARRELADFIGLVLVAIGVAVLIAAAQGLFGGMGA